LKKRLPSWLTRIAPSPRTDSEINVVWVNISYLRKKLKALDANIHIKATRNVGYTLEMIDV